tara:strand:- start:36914 stop:38278 length:1365 start_codon:yes stop_codon:yes gene_type:complete
MKKDLTVAFFAVGSAIKFTKKKLLRSDGSSEYYSLIRLLLKNPNIKRILLLSKSDWNRLSVTDRRKFDPEGKIFDPFTNCPELGKRNKPGTIVERRLYYQEFYRVMQKYNLSADFGVGFISQGWGTNALPGFLNQLKPNKEGVFEKVKCLDMTLFYASEIIWYLNKSMMPWWLLATDPRYVKPSMRNRDIINLPRKILGQQDFDIKWFSLKELNPDASVENDDYMLRDLVSRYSGIEKMNLIDGGVLDPSVDKPHKFTTVSMQLTPNASQKDLRFDILKEYILDRDPEQKARIFGKWSDFFKKDNPQFKGYIATEDLDKTFAETRYTLVLPTAAGWVTSKYAEMLQLGVLPFLHPDYDTQYHIVPKDHPMRVKDANDFYSKMEYFDKFPDKRIKMVRYLQDILISDAYTGKFMIDLLNRSFGEEGLDMKLSDSDSAFFPKKTKKIQKTKNIGLF